jgi:hypothetical protein
LFLGLLSVLPLIGVALTFPLQNKQLKLIEQQVQVKKELQLFLVLVLVIKLN